ncbi:MAG: AI-2E family transporter [Patescibacteria group bacterium]
MSAPLNSTYRVNITISTIFKTVAVLFLLYICYVIKDVLALLFVSLIFASAIDPWVDLLQRHKVPRAISVVFIYLIALVVIGLTVYLIIPPVIEQYTTLSDNFPQYVEKINSGYNWLRNFTIQHGLLEQIKGSIGSFEQNFQVTAGGVFSTISGIFGGIISFFLVLVVTFYMTVEESAMKKIVWSLAPADRQPYLMQLMDRMQRQVGYWFRGELILMLIIGIFVWFGMLFLMPQYALVLGLIAGLMEFIPFVGPTIGAIPGIFLALTVNPFLALLVAILYIIIQQVENNILVPKIMQRAVGLNPIVSIAVIMAGIKIGGVVGGILSIPVATAISVLIKDWVKMRNNS